MALGVGQHECQVAARNFALCIHVCVGGCGSIAKWSGHRPADRKVAGLIPAQDTLVLLLFP